MILIFAAMDQEADDSDEAADKAQLKLSTTEVLFCNLIIITAFVVAGGLSAK